jgi:TetR/AcrR family transcriptional regulator, regulator of cefoperazone and chloramphenicol sensitivity
MATIPKKTPASRRARSPRPDGVATRQHLLEIAGQLFAERGFADTTSKEICERASTPMASVNYHFGSREGLYEAALVEAHQQIMALEELALIAAQATDPKQKLRAVLARIVIVATSSNRPWGFMLMLREMLSPSSAIPALVEKAVRPKAAFMLGLVADVLGLRKDDAVVQRAVLFAVLPCLAMMIAPRQLRAAILPAVDRDQNGLVDDYMSFVLAGLDALAVAHRP